MQTELGHVAQSTAKLIVAGQDLEIQPPSIFRLQKVVSAAFALLAKTEIMDAAKVAGQKLVKDKLAAVDGDASKLDVEEIKAATSKYLIDAVMTMFAEAPTELANLMAEICRANDKSVPVKDVFKSVEFWAEQATISEIQVVLSTFIDLIDIGPLLKNVQKLKGVL